MVDDDEADREGTDALDVAPEPELPAASGFS